MVGTTGFEPATPTTPRWYATKLRYVPLLYLIVKFWRSLVFFIIRLHRTFGSPFACPTRNCPPDTSSQGTCYVPLLYLIVNFWRSLVFLSFGSIEPSVLHSPALLGTVRRTLPRREPATSRGVNITAFCNIHQPFVLNFQ